MTEIAYSLCKKCRAKIPVDSTARYEEDRDVLILHYDPKYAKVVLVNSGSGLRQEIELPRHEAEPAPKSRHLGGIIGPY